MATRNELISAYWGCGECGTLEPGGSAAVMQSDRLGGTHPSWMHMRSDCDVCSPDHELRTNALGDEVRDTGILVRQKVDTIEWAQRQVSDVQPELVLDALCLPPFLPASARQLFLFVLQICVCCCDVLTGLLDAFAYALHVPRGVVVDLI